MIGGMTTTPTPTTTQAWSQALRTLGRRVTRQRLAVLEAAQVNPHASAETILDHARHALPSLTAQSVYQVLADLSEIGLLRKLETPGSPARYETRRGDNHHHVMCMRCGAVEDVACVVGHAPCLTPSEDGGMRIVAADVLFQGVCAACDAAAAEQEPAEQEPAEQAAPAPVTH